MLVPSSSDSSAHSSSTTSLFEAFLLPLVSILSLMLLVLVILCQRHCILDLVAPLHPAQTPTGAQDHLQRRANSSAAALFIETVSGENQK